MKAMEERIMQQGSVYPGNVLKVDCFLNHQLDVAFLDQVGAEFYRLYKDAGINKILTIEASGIAIACMTARYFNVPVVFAKKAKSKNLEGELYTAPVKSFTYGKEYNVTVAQKFLGKDDTVLILDDFLANGQALNGLIDICRQAGTKVAGTGICIEKGYQGGGDKLREAGVRVESLAIVEEMNAETGGIRFRAQ